MTFLGALLENYMDYEIPDWEPARDRWIANRARIDQALAKHGLSYVHGGHITGAGSSAPARTLEAILRERDFAGIQEEFERAVRSIDEDPRSAATAACAIIESMCKVVIEDEGIEMPTDQSIKPLWKAASTKLRLDPSSIADDDLKKILSGMISIVDGLGSFRTHVGSAHGQGRKSYALQPRHARLVVNAASGLVSFVLETWDERAKTRA